ncbi:endogenous retrovirus group K member 25 Pol protein-like protein [Willisornis vidua]|uniref:Endogenous retrovirus group K member 25 Pol protein-like protein n=1 Tax=Willisornis vidua TaxID=1566151 RepID=A0ABQ9DP03_9PASS|nr:endogenous retrovirus group K member 25 Pol protein-like protein [Willisornis vidua]
MGLPSPALIPEEWPIIIIDIKDIYFNIYLHPADAHRFAFTIPSVNVAEPARRYHWTVLPQGMKNSPTICQTVVSRILGLVRDTYAERIIYHYMGDILISAQDSAKLKTIYNLIAETQMAHGLEVALEKTQMTAPWQYLGLLLSARTFTPEKVDISTEVRTLNQLQILLGKINWVCSYLGHSADFLAPLFQLLRGDSDLSSSRQLTPEAQQVLETINPQVSARQVRRQRSGLQTALVIFRGERQPYAIIGQMDLPNRDFVLWESVFPSFQFHKTINTCPEMLTKVVQQRECPFYIQHISSHTDLPGPLVEGNRVADSATNPEVMVNLAPTRNTFEQAKISYRFFHQNAESLRKHFGLSVVQVRAIVSACPVCQRVTPVPPEGVNPRGLSPLDLWQTDVTHVQQFSHLRYVHVSVDTCSGLMVATAHAREKAKDVKRHFSLAFAIMGIPKQVKMDNGPAYVSFSVRDFFSLWGIKHVTGIPDSPQGQAIIERAHLTLKNMLGKQENSAIGLSPQERLNKALYVLNFLNQLHEDNSPVERHFRTEKLKKGEAKVWFQDVTMGEWVGPVPLLTWGRGHICVSTGSSPGWIPSRCVRFHQRDALAEWATSEEDKDWYIASLFAC